MQADMRGHPSPQRLTWSNFKVVANVVAALLVVHMLAVVILSAQSTAAGGGLVLFPLGVLLKGSSSNTTQVHHANSTVGKSSIVHNEELLEETAEAVVKEETGRKEESGRTEETDRKEDTGRKEESSKKEASSKKEDSKGEKKEDSNTSTHPNPIRLPTLPREEQKDDNQNKQEGKSQEPQGGGDGGNKKPDSKTKLLDQLRERRKEVERLMAKRRAEREGISVEEAEKQSEGQRQEAVEKAVLAVEKPQDNVRRAFSGGQNGRFLPAPKILANLFRRDGSRSSEDRSWLDRITDSIIDKLELRWEDDEEARLDASDPSNSGGAKVAAEADTAENEGKDESSSAVSKRSKDSSADLVNRKAWPTDECANVLKIPKVAMMFLTKGDLYHASTWELWFKYAHGWLPIAPVQAACGNKQPALEAAQTACRRHHTGTGEEILANQHLFNVYVHVGLNNQEFKGYPVDSLFHKRDITERVQVEWGRHTLVTATRNLMKVALQEPLNKRLILLSEAGIPLYPPTALYHQLMSEDKSRINSCTQPGWERHPHRWTNRMETPHMKHDHWRKSSQWFGLKREHAELVMADTEIDTSFHDHCYPTTEEGWWRDCFSDEHYFATLLAVLGKENETDCKGFMMHVDWSRGGAHPRTYELREISAARLRLLRMPTENCGYPSAIKTGAAQFIRQEELNAEVCSKEVVEYSNSLGPQCPLFARKFAPETAGALTALIAECKNRLKIVHGHDCQRRLAMMKKYL